MRVAIEVAFVWEQKKTFLTDGFLHAEELPGLTS